MPKGYEDYPLNPDVSAYLTIDDVWERGTAFGSPERVTEQLKHYMHELGCNNSIIQMRSGGLEHDKIVRSMELFAREFMPALREEEVRIQSAA